MVWTETPCNFGWISGSERGFQIRDFCKAEFSHLPFLWKYFLKSPFKNKFQIVPRVKYVTFLWKNIFKCSASTKECFLRNSFCQKHRFSQRILLDWISFVRHGLWNLSRHLYNLSGSSYWRPKIYGDSELNFQFKCLYFWRTVCLGIFFVCYITRFDFYDKIYSFVSGKFMFYYVCFKKNSCR